MFPEEVITDLYGALWDRGFTDASEGGRAVEFFEVSGEYTFCVRIDFEQDIELWWGWADATFCLMTAWKSEQEGEYSSGMRFKAPVDYRRVDSRGVVEAVIAEVDSILLFAEPEMPRQPSIAEVKAVMDALDTRARTAHVGWVVSGEKYAPNPLGSAQYMRAEIEDEWYRLTFWGWRYDPEFGDATKMYELYAYRDEFGWRIDCHIRTHEGGSWEVENPYRFVADEEWPKVKPCGCCEADERSPDQIWLHEAVSKLWVDVLRGTS